MAMSCFNWRSVLYGYPVYVPLDYKYPYQCCDCGDFTILVVPSWS